MKRLFCLILIVAMTVALSGCRIFGGINDRSIGMYQVFLTDGEKRYLKYGSDYVEVKVDGFELCPDGFYIESPDEIPGETEVLLIGEYLGSHSDPLHFKTETEEYKYLYDQIYSKIDSVCFEFILLRRGNDIYGAVNCYNRVSGRSGTLLTFEDLDKSYLLSVEDGNLVFSDAMEKVSVMAVNPTHYISYEDKAFYSVSKETGDKKEICKDIWYEGVSLTYYSYAAVSFIDDIFMISAADDDGGTYKTLIIGNIDGDFEVLRDNVKT